MQMCKYNVKIVFLFYIGAALRTRCFNIVNGSQLKFNELFLLYLPKC